MLIHDPTERERRSNHNQQCALRWMREEKWTTPSILAQVAGLQSRQAAHKFICQLVAKELVQLHKINVVGRTVVTIIGITAHGLAMSWEENDSDCSYCESSRISLTQIPHQIDLQRARLAAEGAGWTNWMRGERLGVHPTIRPDAISTGPDGSIAAIEVERTIKTRRRYQQIISGHLQMIRQGGWERVHYLCPRGVAERLARLFRSIHYIPIGGQRITLEERHYARFSFHTLGDWP